MLGIYPGFGKRNWVSPQYLGGPYSERNKARKTLKTTKHMYVAKETAGFDFTIDLVGQVVKVKVMLSHRAPM